MNPQLVDLVWVNEYLKPPVFTRSDVAKLLNCTPLTVRNRENSGKYPEAKRKAESSHRYYSVQDVLNLQYITFDNQINISSIMTLLWDRGYKETQKLLLCIEAEVAVFRNGLPKPEVKIENGST